MAFIPTKFDEAKFDISVFDGHYGADAKPLGDNLGYQNKFLGKSKKLRRLKLKKW